MKSLWTVMSFLAIVNLLALMLFGGWLWRSDRLNLDRVHQVRELFAPTITQVQMDQAKADEESALNEVQIVPVGYSSQEQLSQLTKLQQREQQVSRRLKEESDMLSRQFEQITQQTEAERLAFEIERTGWEKATRADRERKMDEQFAQTVQQYESIPAKQGKQLLVELIRQGHRQQAVAYLDAMEARSASKILREFKSQEEIVLATELLEDLRTFGLGTVDSETIPDDDLASIPESSTQ
ncbi:MAG: hypothetical protein O7G85_11380 [Planctomycetota bacterium]|nr:hypothetical protein [Planctomycetota bacterium]